jgi:choline dehydrogenase-like flavoprotein
MFVVVGSGPAGVACARALLDKGAEVTMLDAGLELEPDRAAAVRRLAGTPRTEWDDQSLRFMREGVDVEAGGIPLKLAYGSSFPYREPVPLPISAVGVGGKPSYARGGLSNVWGASVMPFRGAEMAGWPITLEELEPHYRAVAGLIPYAAASHNLQAGFPLYHEAPQALRPSSQASAFLRDLEAARTELLARGITFGRSRLAVQAQSNGQPGCVYCGQCLYGCPFGYIFNSSTTLEQLKTHARFTYRGDSVVRSIADDDSGVKLHGVGAAGGATFTIAAERAFVACGIFSTARILLTSLGALGKTIRAVDNCYFLLPLLRYRSEPEATREALHTLAQVFVEVLDPAIGPHGAHLQVYTYNDLFRAQLRNMLGPTHSLFGALADRALLGRLLLIQGYLHSDLSAGIEITLRDDGTLVLSAKPNPRTRQALGALKRKLWAERRAMRALALNPAMRVGAPGRGFHTGGTFPMRTNPAPFETDRLGRPHGMSRVHLVDASVFPTLPATTITFSVMANAHRIGAEAAA